MLVFAQESNSCAGRRHAVLIPPSPFFRGMSESVQHGSRRVVTMANGHPLNDL